MGECWVMTASGRRFWPLAPRAADVHLEDIAHALAAIARFGGHTRVPYSVAQHSVLVSRELAAASPVPEVALIGLLHDAAEAYLGDVPRPLKHSPTYEAYREAERRLQGVIYRAFSLQAWAHVEDDQRSGATRRFLDAWHRRLQLVDRQMLRTEQAQLMPPPAPGEVRDDVAPLPLTIEPWSFADARAEFLQTFARLEGDRRRLREVVS